MKMSFRFRTAKRVAPIEPPSVCAFNWNIVEEAQSSVMSFDTLEAPAHEPLNPISKPEAQGNVFGNWLLTSRASESLHTLEPPGHKPFDLIAKSNTRRVNAAIKSPKIVSDTHDHTPRQESLNLIAKSKTRRVDAVIKNPEIASDAHDHTPLIPPEIIPLLDPLNSPQSVGKDYREQANRTRSFMGARKFANTSRRQSRTRCIHNMIASQCSICIQRRRQTVVAKRGRATPDVDIIDVFRLLKLVLQPPILPLAGQPVIFPNGLKPYPFQISGVKWLVSHKQALLADQMGLGKTIQAIIGIRVLFRKGELLRTLVVCPASMTNVWEREIKSWAPELRPIRVQGNSSERGYIWKSHAEIYIVSYETLRNDIATLSPNKFDLYVLDEAQKIKNPYTKTHSAVKRLAPKYRWALTGTPIENEVDDVIALFNVLKPRLFPRGYFWYVPSEVRKKIKPYILRRTVEDVKLDLPELTHEEHWLDLLPEQKASYKSLEDQGVSDIKRRGEDATRIHVLALITKLKQICNLDSESGQSCKLNFLKDELEDLTEDNEKALVFSQYPVKTLQKIEPKLKQFNPLVYDGSLSSNERDDIVTTFQKSDYNMVLLMSVRAGGTGITLTRANHVFHFDHWWNPAVMDQASARVRRIGQKRPVFVHSLYAADTIEERIVTLLQQKRAVFEDVFGKKPDANDEDLNRLTDEDLFGLFGLNVPDKNKSDATKQHNANGSQLTLTYRDPTLLPPSPTDTLSTRRRSTV